MIKPPKPSSRDLTFLFDAHHHDIGERASRSLKPGLSTRRAMRMQTRRAVQLLANAGLTAYCIPEQYGGAAVGRIDGLDTRALTLIRESLGWADAMLDTAFAMQGLGSYPITLAGSAAQKADTYRSARGPSLAPSR